MSRMPSQKLGTARPEIAKTVPTLSARELGLRADTITGGQRNKHRDDHGDEGELDGDWGVAR